MKNKVRYLVKYVDLTNDTQEIEKDIVTEKELENIMACDVVGIINLIDCMEV